MTGLLEYIDHPPWPLAIAFLLLGIYGLSKGGDLLVAGSVTLSRRLGLTPAVIGATVVAFGTSAPELVVSVTAAIQARGSASGAIDPNGPAAIAIANVVGSNIFNVLFILGITLLLAPIAIPRTTRRIDLPFLLIATGLGIAACFLIGDPRALTRPEAGIFLVGLAAFILVSLRCGASTGDDPETAGDGGSSWPRILGGLVFLLIGGRLCLSGAVGLAEAVGMSQRLIGLTVVAAGTSLPELFASIQAARRGHADIALTNVLGSNIFNLLGILGIAGLITPLPVNQGTLSIDLWWMLAAVVLILPHLVLGKTMGRGLGIVLLLGYAASLTMAIRA